MAGASPQLQYDDIGTSISHPEIPLRYLERNFSLPIEEINHLRDDDLVDLIHRKKLHLVLDLDHTLIHSARLSKIPSKKKEVMKAMHGFHVTSDDRFIVKLRPGVQEFLEQANTMFDLSVYTMGTRKYADEIVQILKSEVQSLRFTWVIAKQDCLKERQKGLDIVLSHEKVILIVDDKKEIWGESYKKNLIEIGRYRCDKKQAKDDKELARVLRILRAVHNDFYESDFASLNGEGEYGTRDVRQILERVQNNLLISCGGLCSLGQKQNEDAQKLGESQMGEIVAETSV